MSFSRPVIMTLPSLVDARRGRRCGRSRLVERLRVERRVEVAAHQLRRLGPHLALLADAAAVPSIFTAIEVDAGHGRALGGGELSSVSATVRHRDDRRLGEPVTRHDADAAELGLHLVVELRRLRRTRRRVARARSGTAARSGWLRWARGTPCGTACPRRRGDAVLREHRRRRLRRRSPRSRSVSRTRVR